MKKSRILLPLLLAISIFSTSNTSIAENDANKSDAIETTSILNIVPKYSGNPYIEFGNNQPSFQQNELTAKSYEYYSKLDSLGRCGYAEACIGTDVMPTEKRGAIGMIKPSGWHTIKYSGIIDGNYLYNRCHLIGYQLTGENANEKNLITGTRYLNVEGMLHFEDMITDYVKETNNHVMYRVTPMFQDNNLVASGIQMEAQSVEDNKICFNVYVYNVQPGITINYESGKSNKISDISDVSKNNLATNDKDITEYILNKNTQKFHKSDCSSVSTIKYKNKEAYTGDRQELLDKGYSPCKRCNP